MRERISLTEWKWGMLQWLVEIDFATKEAEAELAQLKLYNPAVDFEKLAKDVRMGTLKPKARIDHTVVDYQGKLYGIHTEE